MLHVNHARSSVSQSPKYRRKKDSTSFHFSGHKRPERVQSIKLKKKKKGSKLKYLVLCGLLHPASQLPKSQVPHLPLALPFHQCPHLSLRCSHLPSDQPWV